MCNIAVSWECMSVREMDRMNDSSRKCAVKANK